MGQLEKYGLYVLCLVIFLILGVTIWGNPDTPSPQQRNESVPMRVNAGGTSLAGMLPGNGAARSGRESLDDNRRDNGSFNNSSFGDNIPGNMVGNMSGNNMSGNNMSGNNTSGNIVQSLLQPKPRPKPRPWSTPVGNRPQPAISSGPVVRTPDPVKPAPVTPPPVTSSPVAKTRTYTVKSGDYLGRIAQKQLGSARLVGRIRDLNKGLSDKLKIGQVLILPASSSPSVAAASGAYRTYTISKDDTFEGIARRELKAASRVREIQQLNPNVNPLRLMPGKKIKLPLK